MIKFYLLIYIHYINIYIEYAWYCKTILLQHLKMFCVASAMLHSYYAIGRMKYLVEEMHLKSILKCLVQLFIHYLK